MKVPEKRLGLKIQGEKIWTKNTGKSICQLRKCLLLSDVEKGENVDGKFPAGQKKLGKPGKMQHYL